MSKKLKLVGICLFWGLIFSLAIGKKEIKANNSLNEGRIIELVNIEREKNGLEKLKVNKLLSLAAENKANDMFEKQYWSHNSPQGVAPWVFIDNTGYKYRFAGENLARGFGNEEDLVMAWMASELHRKNILNKNYDEVGIANVEGFLIDKEVEITVIMLARQQTGYKLKEIIKRNITGGKLASLFQNRPNWLAVSFD